MSEDLILRAKNFAKQKSLGQNFLVDANILNQIMEVSDLDPSRDVVIEIGSGIGFLTERLVKSCAKLYSVELDKRVEKYLKIIQANNSNFTYLLQDFLSLSVADIVGDKNTKVKIVANIPYQISSLILLHLFGEIGEPSASNFQITEVNILLQKEFAQRLAAKPGTKAHGSMTLLINYWAEVIPCLEVNKNSFLPKPEVDSMFVKIVKRDKPLVKSSCPKALRRFIKAIYANRRKKLANGLKAAGYSQEEIGKLNLAENLRGENLSLQEINEMVEILQV